MSKPKKSESSPAKKDERRGRPKDARTQHDAPRNSEEELAEQGYALLDEGEFEVALELARELEKRQYTAAFDIAAQAHAGLEDIQLAIDTLERGVEQAPECWANWQLLGNYRSDLDDFRGAAEAYERALVCDDTWKDSIRLNQAILANRQEDYAGSIRYLDKIRDAELELLVADTRITALRGLDQTEEAFTLAEQCLADPDERTPKSDALAYIAAAQGKMRLQRGDDRTDIRQASFDAMARFGVCPAMLELLRHLDDRTSEGSRYLRLLIHGELPEPLQQTHDGLLGYFVTYDVVADAPESAMPWIQEIEDLTFPGVSVTLDEVAVIDEPPSQRSGIYWISGRSLYDDGAEQ